MPDWKRLWSDTPSEISGAAVLAVLLMIAGLVNYSWFLTVHPASGAKYTLAAAISGTLTCRLIRDRKLKLDSEHTVTGKQALSLGIVSGILFAESAILAVISLGK